MQWVYPLLNILNARRVKNGHEEREKARARCAEKVCVCEQEQRQSIGRVESYTILWRSGKHSTIVVMKRNETNQSMRHVSGRTCSSLGCCRLRWLWLWLWGPGATDRPNGRLDSGYSSNRNYKPDIHRRFVEVYKMQHILQLLLYLFFCGFCLWLANLVASQ